MGYYYTVTVRGNTFEEAVQNLSHELRKEGFDITSETNYREAFANKLGVPFRNYTVITAANPIYMYRAVYADDLAGFFQPSTFVVQEFIDGKVEISVLDPVSLVEISNNENLKLVANQIQRKIWHVVRKMKSAEVHYA